MNVRGTYEWSHRSYTTQGFNDALRRRGLHGKKKSLVLCCMLFNFVIYRKHLCLSLVVANKSQFERAVGKKTLYVSCYAGLLAIIVTLYDKVEKM